MKDGEYFFSKNLKYLRSQKGTEQQELAEYLGRKSGSAVSEWEKGLRIPDVGTLDMIASFFGVKLDDLMKVDLSVDNFKDVAIETVAAHAIEDLTDDEIGEVLDFIKFQKMKRQNNDK